MGKFNQAQQADEHFFKTFKESKNYIELFEKGIDGILQLLPENEGVSPHNQEIAGLIQKKTAIDKLFAEIQSDFKVFSQSYSDKIENYIKEAKKKTIVLSQIAQISFGNFAPITNKTTEDVIFPRRKKKKYKIFL
jgi:hypothetical protein